MGKYVRHSYAGWTTPEPATEPGASIAGVEPFERWVMLSWLLIVLLALVAVCTIPLP